MPDMTPLGELLEGARERLGLSKREAARRAGISEGRWRQIVAGAQRAGNHMIPVNPRRVTVAAMARAVGVSENEALDAAGLPRLTATEIIQLIQHFPRSDEDADQVSVVTEDPVEALILEIYADPDMPDERKHELVRLIRRAEAQREAELRAAQDELNAWRTRRATA